METLSPDKLSLTIDGRTSEVASGTTILNAARQMGIAIPTLCNYRGIEPLGACRVCIVEMESPRGPSRSLRAAILLKTAWWSAPIRRQIRDNRRTILELLLAQAPESKKLAEFAAALGVTSTPLKRTPGSSCILCGLCVKVCNDLMGRGRDRHVRPRAPTGKSVRHSTRKATSARCAAPAISCVPRARSDFTKVASRPVKQHITAYNQFLEAKAEHRHGASSGGAARPGH